METCSDTVEYSFDDSDSDAVDLILSETDDASRLPRDAALLRKCLADYQGEYRQTFTAAYE